MKSGPKTRIAKTRSSDSVQGTKKPRTVQLWFALAGAWKIKRLNVGQMESCREKTLTEERNCVLSTGDVSALEASDPGAG